MIENQEYSYYEYFRKREFHMTKESIDYPLHFHSNIELCVVLSGYRDLTVGKRKIRAVAPSVTVIDSFSVHSYGMGEGEHCTMIFPCEMVAEFNKMRNGKSFSDVYVENEALANHVMYIVDNFLEGEYRFYQRSCAANMIMSLIIKYLPLVEGVITSDRDLINRILAYTQENYKENISLESAAATLGYAREHLSRVFHKYVNENYPSYVNRLRYEHVCNHEGNGENLMKLIFDAGFQSVQTYYRAKRQFSRK